MNPYFITIVDYHGEQHTINICQITRFRKIQTNQNKWFVTIEVNGAISNTDITVAQYEFILKCLSSWSHHRQIDIK